MNSIVLSLPDDISENPAVILPAADGANPLSFSYSDIDRTVKKWRLVLSRIGIEKGSKVVFVLPNGIEVVVAFLAVVGLSSIAVPVNPQYKEVEYAELFKLIKPSLLVTSKNDSAKHQHESVLSARALGIPVARCSRNMLLGSFVKSQNARFSQKILLSCYTRVEPQEHPKGLC
jgi:acyl-CoA synthetase (AMP-forming)/AMP-acid ligase II